MDKLTKFLRKQDLRVRELALELVEKIIAGDLHGCHVLQLTGFRNRFRLKKGRIRIIFDRLPSSVEIVRITYRDENTYKGL